jgi:hypothetical protein
MRQRTNLRSVFASLLPIAAALVATLAMPRTAHAIINQVDGTIVPVTNRLQQCLDKPSAASAANPAPGDGPGIDAIRDAGIYPQTFTPAVNAMGNRVVSFTMVAEGGGFRDRFGWYNVGDTPFTPAQRHEIYGCRDTAIATGCACPCTAGPRLARPSDSACTHWVNPNIVELDFDCLRTAGAWTGGPIAFYLMTPETSGPCTVASDCTATYGPTAYCRGTPAHCVWGSSTYGQVCPPPNSTDVRIFSTDNTINDDGDYVHFLIYTSRAFSDAFYFGWEDLFRGGDNDFEDNLIRSIGLVPACHPSPEACDGRDNDCDGMVDEDVASAGACGMSVGECHAGMLVCESGAFVCRGATSGSPEVCDGLDNDCNGMVDDGNPGGGAACDHTPEGQPLCRNGTMQCRGGALVCEGGQLGSPEVCDCEDNNCDGRVDENPDSGSLCPGGGACIACGCRTPCAGGEFPCSLGLECRDGFCVPPFCGSRICADTETCIDNNCVDACSVMMCPADRVCRASAGTARCVENNCYGLGCSPGQVCRNAMCIDDPCANVTCPANQFCRGDGECYASCGDVRCHVGERCRGGTCELDPCAHVACTAGQVCENGTCVENRCLNFGCGNLRVCRNTDPPACIDDPCAGVHCPGAPDVICMNGECVRPGLPPLGDRDRVVGTGGGGASCAVRPGRTGGFASVISLLGLAGIAILSRRRRRIGAIATVALAMGAVAASGCQTEPYCLNCNDDAALPETAVRDVNTIEIGCTPTGEEVCDNTDNDCDGQIDEGFDLETDPANCGACGTTCGVPHALPTCRAGRCAVRQCDIGWFDLDTDPSNGCEYTCTMRGDTETCNGSDDNCNGVVDEGFDLQTNAANCGSCGNVCRFTQAAASCVAGACVMGTCMPGFVDLDHNPANGCEYACRASGSELCDMIDNDCDGMTDEDGACLSLFPASDVRLDRASANSLAPAITGDGTNTVGVAYMDLRDSPMPDAPLAEVFFARSTDNGATWTPDVRIDHGTRMGRDSIRPALGWNGNRAVAVWSDFRTSSGYREVWSDVSRDDGATWGTSDVRVNSGTDDAFNVRVAMNSGSIVAVWEELLLDRSRHIMAARSTDTGMTWSANRVDHAPSMKIASSPAVALVGSNVFVAWQDNRNGQTDIYLNRSTDTGATWRSTDTRMDTDAMGSHASERVDVAADSANHVIVTWQDVRNGTGYDIYARVSGDNGVTFASSDQRLDTTPIETDSLRPSVVSLASGHAAVVWIDNRWGRPNLYARTTSDGGATWSATDAQVMAARGASNAVDFAAGGAGNTVFVAWSDDRSGQLDIYANYSTDGGASFQPQDLRLDTGTAGAAASETPAMYSTLAGGTPVAHVVWVDRRNDGINGDIYYRSIR